MQDVIRKPAVVALDVIPAAELVALEVDVIPSHPRRDAVENVFRARPEPGRINRQSQHHRLMIVRRPVLSAPGGILIVKGDGLPAALLANEDVRCLLAVPAAEQLEHRVTRRQITRIVGIEKKPHLSGQTSKRLAPPPAFQDAVNNQRCDQDKEGRENHTRNEVHASAPTPSASNGPRAAAGL